MDNSLGNYLKVLGRTFPQDLVYASANENIFLYFPSYFSIYFMEAQ